MNGKIASAAISACMLISLISVFRAGAASASGNDSIELYAVGESTAEWTTEEVKVGSYSAKLTMPAGTGWVNDLAEVRIHIPEVRVNEVTDWSFWAKGADAYYVPIEFYIDTDGDGTHDKIIVGQKMGTMTNDWVGLSKGDMSMFMTWKNGYEWLWNWDKVVAKYGDATLLRVDIGYGSLGSNEAVTAYVDDLTINGETYELELPPRVATVDIDPDTLNLASKGKWITCYIELPEGYDADDIDISTILLNDAISAEPKPVEVGDYDEDGIADLMVKFSRASVGALLSTGDEVELTVTGEVDGAPFEGSDTIRVIDKGKGK